ncbi:SURF1 family protein [Nocardioides zeae]|uniref:SURF1-like protein n=1 Tax=Nocardioides imazamoxiresistens TaxID=3231893 RepID=A0ABU3PT92_9ACTN|nr:SURF1 family protein [Nocardioides zeae]MDT9592423.1 SURF1 family protein [Nocardioides zeae]
MGSFRFLLSRRWVLFGVVVVLLTYLAYVLGQWQFHRLDDRRDRNELVERNEGQAAVDVREIMSPDVPPTAEQEWAAVTAVGEYAVEDSVVVRYRTRDGAPGVDVVVPLVLDDGSSVLVDRGWMATDNSGALSGTDTDLLPAPPAGEVEITGWVRRDAEGSSTSVSAQQSTRAISSASIGTALDRDVLAGFVDLATESPEAADPLSPPPLPDLGEGPHFFYGLQWWFFGLLAVFGFFYLMYDERRGGPARREQLRAEKRDRLEAEEQRQAQVQARLRAERERSGT